MKLESLLTELPSWRFSTAQLGDAFAELTRRHVFRLRVPSLEVPGPARIGEVVVRYVPVDEPAEPREVRAPLVVGTILADAPAAVSDPVVVEEVAARKFTEAKREGGRLGFDVAQRVLKSTADELRAMGLGSPLAEELLRQAAELAKEEEQRQRVLDWCDGSLTARLMVVSEAHGVVAWVSVEALPPSRAEKRTEDPRRLLMVRVACMARLIEAAGGGAPSVVCRDGRPEETLDSVMGDAYHWDDPRFDPERDFVPDPVPEEIVRWWEAHRGLVSVRCRLHGEIARFDASRSIGMLGAAWDAAVVEYHNRWERSWVLSSDDPECEERCEVRIEPTWEPGGANLLDVEQMWIVTEGGGRPWWSYELLPGTEQ